jgi:hypothetical protein
MIPEIFFYIRKGGMGMSKRYEQNTKYMYMYAKFELIQVIDFRVTYLYFKFVIM